MAKNEKKQPKAEPIEREQEQPKQTAEAVQEDAQEKLVEQLNQKQEQYLRLAAEYDNFRKRTAKEKQDTFQNAKSSVIESFLEIADNFERAKDAAGSPEDYKKGIEMIFQQFLAKLEELGVIAFGEAGESFDPEIHMAVMHIEDEKKGEGEIVEVFQKGYKLGDKVIRHAAVKVAN